MLPTQILRVVAPCALLISIAGCAAQKNADAGAPTAGKVTSVDNESPIPEQPRLSRTSASAEGPPLETLDEAETAYANAQRDLDTLLGAPGGGVALEGSHDDDEKKPPKAAPAPPTTGASQLSEQDSRCERVCLALASLERARDAICRITSDGDERCTKATSSVEKNRERAKVCACPAPKPDERPEP